MRKVICLHSPITLPVSRRMTRCRLLHVHGVNGVRQAAEHSRSWWRRGWHCCWEVKVIQIIKCWSETGRIDPCNRHVMKFLSLLIVPTIMRWRGFDPSTATWFYLSTSIFRCHYHALISVIYHRNCIILAGYSVVKQHTLLSWRVEKPVVVPVHKRW